MHTTSTRVISQGLQKRAYQRLSSYSDEEIFLYLADTVYIERKRFEKGQAKDATTQYQNLLQSASRALQHGRESMLATLMNLVDSYAREIHTHFSNRTYSIAEKLLPGALTRLLTASQPTQLFGADFDPTSRIQVQGDVGTIKELAKNHTLVFTPTHLSNLDSPLIGYGLSSVGLAPVLYGAGLNLFSNPLMAFFMSRLGAYTVDRRKKNKLYKDVLKDYSTETLSKGYHSLFYPGGTRSRAGKLEPSLKKGLLGTLIQAWQDNILNGKENGEIIIIPCTLSCSLVLEAETLIEDSLAEVGKSRYIIMDDEFSEARTIAAYARKVLNLDSSVFLRFGTPLDCLGNLVNPKGKSLDTKGREINRREYICDRNGELIVDPQRDQQYTNRLADSIVASYRKNNIILPTHVAACAAWKLLEKRYPRLDIVQKALLTKEERTFSRKELLRAVDRVQSQILALVKKGECCAEIPRDSMETGRLALERFGSFHKKHAFQFVGSDHILVNAKLALYYGNRLSSYPIHLEQS